MNVDLIASYLLKGFFMKRLTITGHVCRDAELRNDPQGREFAVFHVAVMAGTKDNPKTDWIEVSCNGRLVDVAYNHVKMGVKVYVDGTPRLSTYINSENNTIGVVKLYAHTLELLNKPISSANKE